MKEYFKVKKTPCFPKSFKVYPIERFGDSNDPSMFFETNSEAQKEADRLNLAIYKKETTENE